MQSAVCKVGEGLERPLNNRYSCSLRIRCSMDGDGHPGPHGDGGVDWGLFSERFVFLPNSPLGLLGSFDASLYQCNTKDMSIIFEL